MSAPTCTAHRRLLESATHCQTAAARILGKGGDHARTMLTGLGDAIHSVATTFDADPTLKTESEWSPLFRSVGLLAEYVRQLPSLLRAALEGPGNRICRPVAEMWAEADALHTAALATTHRFPAEIVRDWQTVEGQEAISLARLADSSDNIAHAANLL